MKKKQKRKWIIGTRGSKLALIQTNIVIEKLTEVYPEYQFEIKTIKTKGDTVWDMPLHKIGGKGLFVKEIEEALMRKDIDMAVHSAKDMPVVLEKGLILGSVLERDDPRDAFISETYRNINELKNGSRIGTSSLRRKAQLLNINRELEILELRGNVDTRIKRLKEKRIDGIVLAYAGVKRMGYIDEVKQILPIDIMVPPAGQGAIAIETRDEDELIELLKPINHEKTYKEIIAERTLQKIIGGGCHVPLGINASIKDDVLIFHVMLGKENGEILFKKRLTSKVDKSEKLIEEVIKMMPPFEEASQEII